MKSKKIYLFLFIFIIITIISTIVFIKMTKTNSEVVSKDNSIKEKDEKKILVLFGSESIVLNYNEKYIEPGFYAINSEGLIDTNNVKVENNINSNKAGTYSVIYTYYDLKQVRKVEVLDQVKEKDDKEIKFSLIGDEQITLNLGEAYDELGFIASYGNNDLSKKVTINSNLDLTKAGLYTITYTLIYQNEKIELKRKITIIDSNLKIKLTASNINYTNQDITISVEVLGDNFLYLTLPNGKVSSEKSINYKVSENGTYEFIAYNNLNKKFVETINIQNIDKIPPVGSCSATINTNNTIINIDSKDNNKIKNYIYYDDGKEIITTMVSNYTYNKKASKNIKVKIYDEASNLTSITCKITDNSYELPIRPPSSDNIIFEEETDTLKVFISKTSSYYLTRIWAMNPYTQLNKFDSPEYGKNLYRPSELLKKMMNKNNSQNKLLLGFNASGFYLKNTYDAESVRQYSSYDKTSVGSLVITDGKVIRNAYDHAVKTWYTIGINNDNEMLVFTDSKATTKQEIADKQKWANSVINSGIRNTFTFAAPIMQNGKKTNITTSMPGSYSQKKGLQLICQINKNNFVLFTSSNESRNNAINLFTKLGCQTAFNLDGGGSIAVIYKSKNSETIKTAIGNNRSLTEVAYFTE